MKIDFSKSYIHTVGKKVVPVSFKSKVKTHLKESQDGRQELILETPSSEDLDLQRIIYFFRYALRTAKGYDVLDIGFSFDDIRKALELTGVSEERAGFLFAVNSLLADFSFDDRKSNSESKEKRIKKITVFGESTPSFKKGIEEGLTVGEEVNRTRYLCNTPGTEMSPESLAKAARQAAKGTGVKVSVLNRKKIESLKMGAVLGVGRGSSEGPLLIVMVYSGGKKNDRPIALVGKGLTFDTGGLNIKVGNAVLGMHMDMSGGAAVIHTISAVARLGLALNVVGVVPAVENVIAGKSYKPGDFLTTMSGKTVEVTNTDAEGRLVLADALTYTERFRPKTVIDVATLTGASVMALGDKYSAMFSNSEDLSYELLISGVRTGERVWRMPLGYEYSKEMKGDFTDLVNLNINSTGGGACTAAAFLKEFVGYTDSWAHIDIAPRMKAGEHDCLAKGSVGAPVTLLVDYLKGLQIK